MYKYFIYSGGIGFQKGRERGAFLEKKHREGGFFKE